MRVLLLASLLCSAPAKKLSEKWPNAGASAESASVDAKGDSFADCIGHNQEKEFPEAEAACKRVLAQDPSSVEGHIQLALAYNNQKFKGVVRQQRHHLSHLQF